MGLLDDLQMGFGLKERTEDYDARTARTIAANEAAGGSNDAMRLAQARNRQHSSFLPVSRSRGAQQYLGSREYDEGYTPQDAEDERPFMQRLLFSPASTSSPTPYAIGPLKMDQPLPKFGLLGLLSGLGGMFGRDVPTVSADASPMRVRPVSGYNLGGSAQAGTRFDMTTEAEPIDYSDGIPVQDPASTVATEALANLSDAPALATAPTDMPSRDQILEALYELTGDYQGVFYSDDVLRDVYKKHVIDGVPVPFDRKKVPPLAADPTGVQRLPVTNSGRVVVDDSNLKPYLPNDGLLSPAFGAGDTGYYDQQMNMGVGTDQLFTPQLLGMKLITTGPHAGKYIDANGRLVMP